jgi:hypothetical protein
MLYRASDFRALVTTVTNLKIPLSDYLLKKNTGDLKFVVLD